MIDAWRLASPEHGRTVGDMLSGDGARRYGGRWNSPGRRAVYLGGSLALAAMELLVHLRTAAVLGNYRKLRLRIPEALVMAFPRCDLPADWATPRLHPATQKIGGRWLESGTSAVLSVPSAIVIGEVNYIVNPRYPDFCRIKAGAITGFRFEARVVKTW